MGLYEIPRELRDQDSWVCSRSNSKCPLQSNNPFPASASDPSTWSSFDDALASVKLGLHDYMGYVFHDTGIVGIDVDVGFEDGILTPLGIDIISHCRSYTEKSKSGRGFHVFVKGTLPFAGRNNRAGVEMYQTKRFFIMTGEQFMFDKIISNQEAIDYVVEKYMKTEDDTAGTLTGRRIYDFEMGVSSGGNISLSHCYPPIGEGSRNVSLLSLGGQLMSIGYSDAQIYKELLKCNAQACEPPLSEREVEAITTSVLRYRGHQT